MSTNPVAQCVSQAEIQRSPDFLPLANTLSALECRQDFSFGAVWNGRYYNTKQVRPIFVEEGGEIVVVTVYAYYF